MSEWGPFSLTGRHAIVTGAAMGIGFGIARRFLEAGADVLLVDNAGIFPQAPVLAMSAEFLDRVLRVNLRGLVLASKAAAQQLVAQGGGVIVNIASVDALHPSMVGLAAYDASKAGVFTRSLALELAPHGRAGQRDRGGWRARTSRPLGGSGMTAEQAEQFQAEFVRTKGPAGPHRRPR